MTRALNLAIHWLHPERQLDAVVPCGEVEPMSPPRSPRAILRPAPEPPQGDALDEDLDIVVGAAF